MHLLTNNISISLKKCYPPLSFSPSLGRSAATVAESDAVGTVYYDIQDVMVAAVEDEVHQRGDIGHCHCSVAADIGIVDDEVVVGVP